MTRGVCSDYTEKIKRQIISMRGEWSLNNWHNETKLDVLDLYLSDTGFNLYMKTFVDWFLEITPEIERELKLEQLGI
jgi:hypothetical protein